MIDRRMFLALGASAGALGQTPAPPDNASPVSPFADPDFGFSELIALGGAYYRAGDPGKLLAILSHVKPGDFESAYSAFHDAAAEARILADSAVSRGHKVSAREAYLWAAARFSCAMRFLDGTKDPARMLPCWRDYAACWSAAVQWFDPPAERIEIPYEGAHLTGWVLRADASGRPRPLVILNNGADGLELSMYLHGAAGALSRGYNCLIFNGPGQGDSLWERKLWFRPDWEKVITPVVDLMVRHPAVDPKRIALIGVSQGGYWVARALAFEPRIAAGVADPGVFDVSEPWRAHMPPFVLDMVRAEKKEQFDNLMASAASNPRTAMLLRFRMRPYGMTSYYDVYRAVQQYNLAEVAGRIRCPMLVTDSEGEQFFPGQARKLYDALQSPKQLVRFTREQGADQHCEVAAPGLRDFTIYNWLDELFV